MRSLSCRGAADCGVVFFVCLALLGCGKSAELQDRVLRCAELEGAKSSPLRELAEAAREIETRGEGPAQLSQPAGDAESSAAAALSKALGDGDRLRLYPLLEKLVIPEAEFYADHQVFEMRQLLAEEKALCDAVRNAVTRPAAASAVNPALGFFDRYRFLDDAAIAARLHQVAAVAALADGERELCLDEAENVARWVQWLSKEPRLEARLLAARLRSEWLDLIRVLVGRPCGLGELQRVFSAMRNQLNDWPPDRSAFVCDRAMTLHAYEAVRLGMIDRVITNQEKIQLEGDGWLEKVKAIDAPSVDRDELVYLRAMEEVILLSDLPYHERAERLGTLFEQLAPEGELGRQAPLASRLFLTGLPDAIEQIARDRALMEAWSLAIAAAASFDPPPYRVNPMSGRVYRAERRPDGFELLLSDVDSPDPFVMLPEETSGR